MLIEAFEQFLNQRSLGELLAEQPQRGRIGNAVLDAQPQKPRERQPVAHLIFCLLVRKIVQGLQHQHAEHHNRIGRLPASVTLLHLVRRQHDRLDVGAKTLPWNQPIDGFERIALRRQRRQPFLRIEKTELTHPRLPNHAITHETRTDQSVQLFFEAPLRDFEFRVSYAACSASKRFRSLASAFDEALDYRAQGAVLQGHDGNRPWPERQTDGQYFKSVEPCPRHWVRRDKWTICKKVGLKGPGKT